MALSTMSTALSARADMAGFGTVANRPMAEYYLPPLLFRRTNFIAAIVANDAATAMSIVFIVFLLSYNRSDGEACRLRFA